MIGGQEGLPLIRMPLNKRLLRMVSIESCLLQSLNEMRRRKIRTNFGDSVHYRVDLVPVGEVLPGRGQRDYWNPWDRELRDERRGSVDQQ